MQIRLDPTIEKNVRMLSATSEPFLSAVKTANQLLAEAIAARAAAKKAAKKGATK